MIPREEKMESEIIKAVYSSKNTAEFLREILHLANGVEAILILQLIEDAAKLNQRINQLREAIE